MPVARSVPLASLPAAPTNVTVTRQDNNDTLVEWAHSGGVTSFSMYVSTAGGNFVPLASGLSLAARSYNDLATYPAGASVVYHVVARNGFGPSAVAVSPSIVANPVPAAPTNVTAVVQDTNDVLVTATRGDTTNDSHRLEASVNAGPYGSLITGLPATDISHQDTTARSADDTVQYRAYAVNEAGSSAAAASNTVTPNPSGGFAAPDIFTHDFSDGTSSDLHDGSNNPFIPNTAWVLEETGGDPSGRHVRQTYPVSGGNTGAAFFLNVPDSTELYIAVSYKRDSGWAPGDFVKFLRIYTSSISGPYANLGIDTTGANWLFDWGFFGGSQPGFTPSPNSSIGDWLRVEWHVDVSTDGAFFTEVWFDGVSAFTNTQSLTRGGITFGTIQFDGTINSVAEQSTGRFGPVHVSTQRIGWGV